MEYSNEEIDQYIEELKIKSEINDYVFHNIYPESLNKYKDKLPKEVIISRASHKFPKLSEHEEPIIQNIGDYNIEFKDVEKKLIKMEKLLKNIKEDEENKENEHNKENKENKENDNECPVCLETFHNKSYFTGSCGHIFCAKCICINMNRNSHTGNLCPLCRTNIL
jgi:DNA repair exonuclease SbcCD ATPase subunit